MKRCIRSRYLDICVCAYICSRYFYLKEKVLNRAQKSRVGIIYNEKKVEENKF